MNVSGTQSAQEPAKYTPDVQKTERFDSGSRWHRWEPHVHAPGTIINDQFKGPDAWDRYLIALETSTPRIRAIGVTDYYDTETYERVCGAKQAGRLTDCSLVFPNIEMRLNVGTVKGKWVNVHLIVSPDDPEHLLQLHRLLARLTFAAYGDKFSCTREDLKRLGRAHDAFLTTASAALQCGAQQFKVSFDQLKETLQSDWAQENVLVAVAGSETDGAGGVRDAADAALRQEIERFAHVIFASSAAQREFWLGQRSADEETLRVRYGGLKPCLHGSDAHDDTAVGAPEGDRYSWVKGAIQFDALRQACIDPAGRAYVGPQSPAAAAASNVISRVEIRGADWVSTPTIALNPGLIAIIGARGSGKTALADVIALGCEAFLEPPSPGSFLSRARDLLQGASVSLHWACGQANERALDGSEQDESFQYPRARYLSQQFVEELCSAHGVTDALMHEIQRVIFVAHSLSDRGGAVDFDELLELKASRFRTNRRREEEALANLSESIGIELEKQKLVEGLKKQLEEKKKLVAGYQRDREKLVAKGSEVRVLRLEALTKEAEKVRGCLRFFAREEQSLLGLRDEVGNVRTNQAPEALRQMRARYKTTGLVEEEWSSFLLDYKGDVDSALNQHLAKARKGAQDWRGVPPSAPANALTPVIPDEAKLDRQPLAVLEAEIARLEKLVSIDRDTSQKFAALSKRIAEEGTAISRLEERLVDCEGAKARINVLVQEREASYGRVFDAITSEQQVLLSLYQPLRGRLDTAKETLQKLSFSVGREADIERWAADGESLLDLRQRGPFKGRGTLAQVAESMLKPDWEGGLPEAVVDSMSRFRTDHQDALLEHSPVPRTDQADYRTWLKTFAKWLYGTKHISIRYSIDYDGVDIRKLSPGTRGIVLLLLYLALDDADDRPLIIDQPEENLDPKSIFDELVGLFVAAKQHRQVIMVTHNANLVVNTDADQIIVATAGPHAPGALPPITYISGGLESHHIRKAVCDILEGGERAFRERARRLRVRLERP